VPLEEGQAGRRTREEAQRNESSVPPTLARHETLASQVRARPDAGDTGAPVDTTSSSDVERGSNRSSSWPLQLRGVKSFEGVECLGALGVDVPLEDRKTIASGVKSAMVKPCCSIGFTCSLTLRWSGGVAPTLRIPKASRPGLCQSGRSGR
jgi:hypothetical protein